MDPISRDVVTVSPGWWLSTPGSNLRAAQSLESMKSKISFGVLTFAERFEVEEFVDVEHSAGLSSAVPTAESIA